MAGLIDRALMPVNAGVAPGYSPMAYPDALSVPATPPTEFGKGLRRLIPALNPQGFVGTLAQPFFPEWGQQQIAEHIQAQQLADAENQARVPSVTGVHSPGDLGDYLAGNLPAMIALGGASLAGGGVGRVIGGLRGAASGLRSAELAGSMVNGARLGAALPMVPQTVGEAGARLQEDPYAMANSTPTQRTMAALAGGGAQAAIYGGAMGGLTGPAAGGGVLANVLHHGAVGAGTMAAADVAGNLGQRTLDPNQPVVDPEQMKNSLALGGIFGGLSGIPHGALGEAAGKVGDGARALRGKLPDNPLQVTGKDANLDELRKPQTPPSTVTTDAAIGDWIKNDDTRRDQHAQAMAESIKATPGMDAFPQMLNAVQRFEADTKPNRWDSFQRQVSTIGVATNVGQAAKKLGEQIADAVGQATDKLAPHINTARVKFDQAALAAQAAQSGYEAGPKANEEFPADEMARRQAIRDHVAARQRDYDNAVQNEQAASQNAIARGRAQQVTEAAAAALEQAHAEAGLLNSRHAPNAAPVDSPLLGAAGGAAHVVDPSIDRMITAVQADQAENAKAQTSPEARLAGAMQSVRHTAAAFAREAIEHPESHYGKFIEWMNIGEGFGATKDTGVLVPPALYELPNPPQFVKEVYNHVKQSGAQVPPVELLNDVVRTVEKKMLRAGGPKKPGSQLGGGEDVPKFNEAGAAEEAGAEYGTPPTIENPEDRVQWHGSNGQGGSEPFKLPVEGKEPTPVQAEHARQAAELHDSLANQGEHVKTVGVVDAIRERYAGQKTKDGEDMVQVKEDTEMAKRFFPKIDFKDAKAKIAELRATRPEWIADALAKLNEHYHFVRSEVSADREKGLELQPDELRNITPGKGYWGDYTKLKDGTDLSAPKDGRIWLEKTPEKEGGKPVVFATSAEKLIKRMEQTGGRHDSQQRGKTGPKDEAQTLSMALNSLLDLKRADGQYVLTGRVGEKSAHDAPVKWEQAELKPVTGEDAFTRGVRGAQGNLSGVSRMWLDPAKLPKDLVLPFSKKRLGDINFNPPSREYSTPRKALSRLVTGKTAAMNHLFDLISGKKYDDALKMLRNRSAKVGDAEHQVAYKPEYGDRLRSAIESMKAGKSREAFAKLRGLAFEDQAKREIESASELGHTDLADRLDDALDSVGTKIRDLDGTPEKVKEADAAIADVEPILKELIEANENSYNQDSGEAPRDTSEIEQPREPARNLDKDGFEQTYEPSGSLNVVPPAEPLTLREFIDEFYGKYADKAHSMEDYYLRQNLSTKTERAENGWLDKVQARVDALSPEQREKKLNGILMTQQMSRFAPELHKQIRELAYRIDHSTNAVERGKLNAERAKLQDEYAAKAKVQGEAYENLDNALSKALAADDKPEIARLQTEQRKLLGGTEPTLSPAGKPANDKAMLTAKKIEARREEIRNTIQRALDGEPEGASQFRKDAAKVFVQRDVQGRDARHTMTEITKQIEDGAAALKEGGGNSLRKGNAQDVREQLKEHLSGPNEEWYEGKVWRFGDATIVEVDRVQGIDGEYTAPQKKVFVDWDRPEGYYDKWVDSIEEARAVAKEWGAKGDKIVPGYADFVAPRDANAQNPNTSHPVDLTPDQQKVIVDDTTKKLGPQMKTLFEKEFKGPGGEAWSGEWTPGVIKLALNAINPTTVAYHEQLHELFHRMRAAGHTEATHMVERVFSTELMKRKLQVLLAGHTNALKQLDTPEEAAAFGYQFWEAGQLKVGPQTAGFFKKIANFLRRVTGLLTDEQRTHDIFRAFSDGKMAEPSVAAQVLDKIVHRGDTSKATIEKLKPIFTKGAGFIMPAYDEMLRSGNPHYGDLARSESSPAVGGKLGERPGRIQTRGIETRRWNNAFADAVRGLQSKEEFALLDKVLGENKSTTFAPVNEAADKVRGLLKDFYRYMSDRGVTHYDAKAKAYRPIHEKADYGKPVVWDWEKLEKDPDGFEAMLRQPKYADKLAAWGAERGYKDVDASIKALKNGMTQNSGVEMDHELKETNNRVGISPYMQSVNRMSLGFIDHADKAPFLSDDIIKTMTTYLSQSVRRAEYQARYGNGGEKAMDALTKGLKYGILKELSPLGSDGLHFNENLLKEVKELGALDENKGLNQAQLIQKAVDGMDKALPGVKAYNKALKAHFRAVDQFRAMEGTLGYDKIGPKMRKFNSWMTTYQSVRLLPLVLLSSQIDPWGIVVRGAPIRTAMDAYKRGIKEVINSWRGKETHDADTTLAEFVGTIEHQAFLDTFGSSYDSMFMTAGAKKVSDKLFHHNGMEAWNRAMRTQATVAATEFIKAHAKGESEHSQRWLEELGLKASDVKTVDGKLAVSKGDFMGLNAKLDEHDAQRMEDTMRFAINQWVDGAMMRPNAAMKPTWASDPRFALLFYLRQFSYAFQKTYLARAANEYKNGNMSPAMALLPFVPTMIAADTLRGILLGTHPMAGMSAGEVLFHGGERSGLFGIAQLGADEAHHPLDAFGPVVQQAVNAVSDPVWDTAKNAMPLTAAINAVTID